MHASSISGHLIVDSKMRKGARVYVAKYMTAAGKPTRKILGEAWVKDSGRKTPRGAVIWRAADGSCPEGLLTPKAAQMLLDDLLAAERGRPRTVARHHARTLTDAVEAWLDHREHEKRLKPSTLTSYRNDAKQYLYAHLGADLPLRRVTEAKVEGMQSALFRKGLSPRTVQKAMVELHGVLALAERRGWIASNPCAALERVKVKRRRDLMVLTPEQVFDVAAAAGRSTREISTDRRELYAAMILFSAFSGLRLGEARALRWEDVDFVSSKVQVRRSQASGTEDETAPKSGMGRMVPLIPQAARVLDELSKRPHFVASTDRVFPSESGGVLPEGAPRIALYDALSVAGLGHQREREKPFRWHDLRHVFGTLAAEVFPLRDVMAYMGHEDISTTMIYLHHVPQHDAADRMGALIERRRAPVNEDARSLIDE